jgi:hypothetical protein
MATIAIAAGSSSHSGCSCVSHSAMARMAAPARPPPMIHQRRRMAAVRSASRDLSQGSISRR